MWKFQRDQDKAVNTPKPAAPPAAPVVPEKPVVPPKQEVRPMEPSKPADYTRPATAHIGKSVVIKGQLSGSEDLYVDGEVEGSVELAGQTLTIGPNGKVRASLSARDVVILGQVTGNVTATERVELRKAAVLNGDIVTKRISIEDGAFFKGGIDIQREARQETKQAAASVQTPAQTPTPTPAAVKTT